MINKITDENTEDYKHQLYEIDNELFYISEDNSIYRIDFNKDDEEQDASKNDDLNQDISETEDETELEDNSEKDPKKDGSGEGKLTKSRGKEESEEEDEDLDENKDKKQDSIDVINLDGIDVDDPNLIINIKNAIKNKTKGGCDMDFEMKETSETKPDGSEAMKERRITQCVEETGKSREACTKEVREKMHDKDAEAVNPEDMNEEEDTAEEKEDIIEEKKDTVEVCEKEYDFLKKQSEELKVLKEEKEKAENELESFKADFLKFKKKIDDKEAIEIETKHQEVIKRISYDFDIPEVELKDDSIEELEKLEKRFEMALKRDTKDGDEETFGEEEDFKEVGDRIHKRYFLEV